MVINTSRCGLIDSNAAIEALKQQKVSALGMDVYENKSDAISLTLANLTCCSK